jgi:uncharacterized protein (TIGR03067 family)
MNWLPAFSLALIVTAPGQKDVPKDKVPSIVGEWICVKAVAGGQEFPDPKEKGEIGAEFMADGKFSFRFSETTEGTYKTDTSKDPAVLEITDSKKRTKKMIYKVEKDTLVVCWADGDRECPTKFESPAGMRIVMITFSRGEKKKD